MYLLTKNQTTSIIGIVGGINALLVLGKIYSSKVGIAITGVVVAALGLFSADAQSQAVVNDAIPKV